MSGLVPVDVLGWCAAALTLATFTCRDMLKLRLLALAANMAFISYGLSAGLWPVATLHLLLVPVNLRRLLQLRQAAPVARPRRWAPRHRRVALAPSLRQRSGAQHPARKAAAARVVQMDVGHVGVAEQVLDRPRHV